jgi:hypothetical protein
MYTILYYLSEEYIIDSELSTNEHIITCIMYDFLIIIHVYLSYRLILELINRIRS